MQESKCTERKCLDDSNLFVVKSYLLFGSTWSLSLKIFQRSTVCDCEICEWTTEKAFCSEVTWFYTRWWLSNVCRFHPETLGQKKSILKNMFEMGGSTTILFKGCTLSRLVTKRWRFSTKVTPLVLKKRDYFNRKIHLPTIIFQRKIHQPNLHIWLMLWWMVSMKFVQGCHSSSQWGGAKSSGDPSGTALGVLECPKIQLPRNFASCKIFKTNDPKPKQRRNMAVAFVLVVFFLVENLSGKEIIQDS